MNNNDIFKKLRVALMLRDDQIEEILMLVDFRMSKAEIGNFFRSEDHPKFVSCGDQVLRNFLNGLVIYLRGTKENPKNPMDEIAKNKQKSQASINKTDSRDSENVKQTKTRPYTPKTNQQTKTNQAPKRTFDKKKPPANKPVVEKVRFKNGKKNS